LEKTKNSLIKFKEEQIRRKDLEKILKAGNFAPNAGGGQRSIMAAVNNKELTTKTGRINLAKFDRSSLPGSYVSEEQPGCIDNPAIKNGFYNAHAVVAIFGQGNFTFRVADAFCMAENMVLQATELGISSCMISRGGEETFASKKGSKLLKEWGVPDNYICSCFVILGYIDGEQPQSKPRKPGRVKIAG